MEIEVFNEIWKDKNTYDMNRCKLYKNCIKIGKDGVVIYIAVIEEFVGDRF